MGSSLSQQLCCVVCERCREQEAADAEPSETKPILQSPGDTRTFLDTQSPTPALKVPTQGSKGLSQDRQPSADALEENGEPCSAAEGWEAAWNPMDFFVAPADEEVEGEVEGSTQQEKVDKTKEEIKPVPDVPVGDTALGAELVAEEEQPGPGGAPCAGITLREGNLSPAELLSEAERGQGCETEPPAEPTGILLGSDLVLCAMEVAGQPEPLQGAETSPRPAQRAELTCLLEATCLLTLQSPAKVRARGVAELCSTSPVSWEPLCPQWGSLEPPNHLLELLKQGRVSPTQGMDGSLSPAGLSELFQQPQEGGLCELGGRECTPGPEAEPQHGITQPALELLEESAVFVPGKQEAEFPPVPPSLPEGLGSTGEVEAENAEA
ncbi:uncharacterized protein [Chamaea fasciata]|uniref:uncharacterized protein n=1 Tax=Chamaea fasciata TaxID=190680 RepID=UPI00336A12A5